MGTVKKNDISIGDKFRELKENTSIAISDEIFLRDDIRKFGIRINNDLNEYFMEIEIAFSDKLRKVFMKSPDKFKIEIGNQVLMNLEPEDREGIENMVDVIQNFNVTCDQCNEKIL